MRRQNRSSFRAANAACDFNEESPVELRTRPEFSCKRFFTPSAHLFNSCTKNTLRVFPSNVLVQELQEGQPKTLTSAGAGNDALALQGSALALVAAP